MEDMKQPTTISKPGAADAASDKTVSVKKDIAIKVVATAKGFYGNMRIKEGTKFTIKSEKDFSKNWMSKI